MDIRLIPLDQIDLDDRLFFIEHDMLPSIGWEAYGRISQPIWLQVKAASQYRIVDGFGFVNYLILNKKATEVEAKLYDNSNYTPLWENKVLKKIHENQASVFCILESLANLLTFLNSEISPPELDAVLGKAGFPKQALRLDQIIKMVEKLKNRCHFVDLNSLKYKDLLKLSNHSAEDLQNYSHFFKDLILKGNKLSSMIQLLDELAKGYGVSSADLLQNAEVKRIHDEVAEHQRYKQLKQLLLVLRWPELNQVMDDWQNTLSKLKFSKGIAAKIDPYFEGDELEFVLKAGSYSDFSELLMEINQKSNSKWFEHLFELI